MTDLANAFSRAAAQAIRERGGNPRDNMAPEAEAMLRAGIQARIQQLARAEDQDHRHHPGCLSGGRTPNECLDRAHRDRRDRIQRLTSILTQATLSMELGMGLILEDRSILPGKIVTGTL